MNQFTVKFEFSENVNIIGMSNLNIYIYLLKPKKKKKNTQHINSILPRSFSSWGGT